MRNHDCRGKSYFAYHKNRIQELFLYTFQAEKTKTESNNSFIIDFKWKKTKTKSNNCFVIDFNTKI